MTRLSALILMILIITLMVSVAGLILGTMHRITPNKQEGLVDEVEERYGVK